MPKNKQKAITVEAPQTMQECNDWIAKLGAWERERVRLEAKMGDDVAAIKLKYEGDVAPIDTAIGDLRAGIKAFAEANRVRLTNDGRVKSHRFPAGVVGWRTQPAKVTIRGVDAVIEKCRELGMRRFLRMKTEINKDRMLAEPDAARLIPGVTIKSDGEAFEVKPDAEELVEGET
ncbi:MAG: host-nuclease inhibitor Gam family protein [Pseudomonadota bacterium]